VIYNINNNFLKKLKRGVEGGKVATDVVVD
jgi:hypothetical protein